MLKILKVAGCAHSLVRVCLCYPSVREDEFRRVVPIALMPLPDADEMSCPLNTSSGWHTPWEKPAGSTGPSSDAGPLSLAPVRFEPRMEGDVSNETVDEL